MPVPAGSGTANYTLNFPAGTFAGATVARFRLFPGTVAAPAPTGAAAGGEVEDYPVTVAGTPIFLGCSDLVTFDTGNENWRAATTDNGTTVILAPQPVEWGATAGNPGGAVIEDDLDGNWTELWTPVLGANGFTSDYSFALGQMLQFDYRNNTGISYNIYVAIRGVNGDFVYFNFRPQIVTSTQWNRIRVPMDASLWLNGFNNALGPVGPAPTAADFAAILANVDRFAFSIEGQGGPDRTAFDNFGQPCDDLGDAPESYNTSLNNQGAVHPCDRLQPGHGYGTADARLDIDIENDGHPTAGADGDDNAGSDDEDGVAAPITRVVGQPTGWSCRPRTTPRPAATLAGWIDFNGNGTFETAERVSGPRARRLGDGQLHAELPGRHVHRQHVRPLPAVPGDRRGPARRPVRRPAGEVEDYPVTVTAPVVTCATNASFFNTANNGAGGSPARRSRDRNWEAGLGTAVAFPASWIDAFVVLPSPARGHRARSATPAGSHSSPTPTRAPATSTTTSGSSSTSQRPCRSPASCCRWTSTPTTRCPRCGSTASPRARSSPACRSRCQHVFPRRVRRRRPGIDDAAATASSTARTRSSCASPAGLASSGSWPRCGRACCATTSATRRTATGRLLASDGPRHGMSDFVDATSSTALMLGSSIDAEIDGLPTAAADGDDGDNADDENGVAGPISLDPGVATLGGGRRRRTAPAAGNARRLDRPQRRRHVRRGRARHRQRAGELWHAELHPDVPGSTTTTRDTYARFRLFPGVVAAPLPPARRQPARSRTTR